MEAGALVKFGLDEASPTPITARKPLTSFELFRNQLANAQVISFDELFDKTLKLVAALEASPAIDDDEIDF